MSSENVPGYIVAFVGSVIASLASVVAYLHKLGKTDAEKQLGELRTMYSERQISMEADVIRLKAESAECRKDREELRVSIARLEERLSIYIQKHGGDSDIEMNGPSVSIAHNPQG